jgi:hypothetical protein
MSTCWKCGRQLLEGNTECEHGCSSGSADFSDAELAEIFRRQARNTVLIDWNKVQTMEDVRIILAAMFGFAVYFPQGVPDSVKKFLREGGKQP